MNTRNFLFVSIALFFLLGAFLISGIINNQHTLFALFQEEARSFLSLIALAQENSIFAEGELENKVTENLLNIIYYINETGLNKENIDRLRRNFNLSSLLIYEPAQKKIILTSGMPHEIDYQKFQENEKVTYHYFSVLGEHYIRLIYRGERFIYQIELSAEEVKKFSQSYGIGKILTELAVNPAISYIALQDLKGIIFATPGVKALPRIENDAVLLKTYQTGEEVTRIIKYNNKKILEIVRPFTVEKETVGLFRIGMNLDRYHQYVKDTYIQLGIIFLILLAGGIALFAVFIRQQSYQIREQFFTQLLGSIAEGILLTDEKGKIKGVNRMFTKITGIPETDLLNQQYEKIFLQDEFSVKLVRETGKFVEEEKEIYQKVIKYATYPLYLSGQIFTGTISIVNDLTHMRAIEKEQQEKERLSLLGNLVANFAHEIRNPLNGLAIAAQRLQIEFPSSDATYNQLLTALIREIDALNRVVSDFLSLARPKVKIKQDFDLSQLVKELSCFIKEQAKAKGVKYSEIIEENIILKGNPEELRRAIINLLLNALEAVTSGSILEPEIRIELRKGRKNIKIRIMDNGPGIPPPLLKKIFEPYFTTKKGGTGLGLYIAQKIIHDHNGAINVQNKKGGGTVFTILLPFSEIKN